jgi:phosphoglycolate phosphatase-like HAD superfamily hydrolase
MAPKAVFLDFGGTLVRPLPGLLPLVRRAARRTGAVGEWEAFEAACDGPWAELWPNAPRMVGQRPSFADLVHERALRQCRVEGSIDALVAAIREEATSPRWHPPFPEVDRTLDDLRARGYDLHLVSNNVD